jgi:small subunit ribosomal protein S21
MIIIEVGKRENIDRALKRYKYKVIKSKQMDEVRKRQEFTKKSQKRRKKLEKAKYIQKLRDQEYDS